MAKPKITIAELRAKNNKMSQKELASKIGVAYQTIVAWEDDITVIKGDNLLKLCEFFGVSSSDLLGR
ncbi:TPA: helix-turn-helix domain-containing protein [Streptococcus suis]|nr:helix-turn-helix transcriptional regulator [Streptococcus suis]HEM4631906.1 helix-turn-helix transcriptional regulator [Streptococcus suis]